jgi:hypothetical protein
MLHLGNFSIPSTECEPVEDVIYIEPPIERINEAIEQVNCEKVKNISKIKLTGSSL